MADDHSSILHSEHKSDDTLIVVFIPGKDKHDKELRDQELWAKAAEKLLGELYGGATAMPPARGSWYNPETQEVMVEAVILIHCYVRASDISDRSKMESLAKFLHRMGRETKQGEVAVLIGGTFHRIRKFDIGE